jgi:cation-transporting ATPase E
LVALVPEGLVVLTTLAFLLAAVQLARQQALVQELPAVEGLARVDVICLDKTGTLTHGEITYDGFELVNVVGDVTGCDRGTVHLAHSNAEECAKRTVPLSHQHAQVEDILGAFAHDPNPNATAQAIARAIGPSQQEVVARVPFSSARKYSALTFADGQAWVFGAPEIIAGDDRALMERTNELAAAGVRTVVLAKVADLVDWGEVTPIALVELTEQIRDDAAETIAYFASQDVAVKVISGDNPITVAAVARRVGLLTEGGDGGHHEDVTRGRGCCHASCDNTPGPLSHLSLSTVVDARDLPDTVEELTKIVDGIIVFGRVTPEKKQLIVRALQACGHTVAMTGDGVNDILALKDADVGVAMGNGASATKAVAQIVLLDSRFSHMPQVLAEGRRLIGNVERVASLFVTKNVMAAALIISTAIIGVGFPFIPRQMTLLSTLTIGIPAFLLALGPNKRKYVPGFLGRVLALSVPAGIAAGLATFIAFSFGLGSDPQRSTLALVVLFAVNFWLLFVLSRPVATWKLLTIAGVVGLAVLAFTLRVTRDFLQLDLPTGQWPLAIGLGIAGATCVELAHRLRRARSWSNPFRRRVDVHRAEP